MIWKVCKYKKISIVEIKCKLQGSSKEIIARVLVESLPLKTNQEKKY